MQTEQGRNSLQDLIPTYDIMPPDCSQRLWLEQMTANLEQVRPEEQQSDSEPAIALLYKNRTYVFFFETTWDINTKELKSKSTVKGILLPTAK